MLRVIIPAAGRGSRFAECGYKEPKPLINVNGTTMLELVIDNFKINYHAHHEVSITYITLKEYLEKYTWPYKMSDRIVLEELTNGAATTIFNALSRLKYSDNDELFIRNSDDLCLQSHVYTNCIKYWRKTNSDGGIMCFAPADGTSKWSYVELQNDLIIKVAEKNPISPFATFGGYYFRRIGDFKQAYSKMVEMKDMTKNEYYLCPVFNHLINSGKTVRPYLVNEVWGLGTPEDLNKYLAKYI